MDAYRVRPFFVCALVARSMPTLCLLYAYSMPTLCPPLGPLGIPNLVLRRKPK